MQEQLVIPFFCPEIEKAGNRRRTRTVASSDAAITSRRDRLEKRNRIMTAVITIGLRSNAAASMTC